MLEPPQHCNKSLHPHERTSKRIFLSKIVSMFYFHQTSQNKYVYKDDNYQKGSLIIFNTGNVFYIIGRSQMSNLAVIYFLKVRLAGQSKF